MGSGRGEGGGGGNWSQRAAFHMKGGGGGGGRPPPPPPPPKPMLDPGLAVIPFQWVTHEEKECKVELLLNHIHVYGVHAGV